MINVIRKRKIQSAKIRFRRPISLNLKFRIIPNKNGTTMNDKIALTTAALLRSIILETPRYWLAAINTGRHEIIINPQIKKALRLMSVIPFAV